MPDSLKVFLNQVDQAVTPTTAAHSIPLLTTDANTAVVVKDLKFLYSDNSTYKRPMKLSLDGFPLRSMTSVNRFDATGSLIVGKSSTLSLEVEGETEVTDFGVLKGLIERSDAKIYAIEHHYLGQPGDVLDTASVYAEITDGAINTGVTPSNAYSTATFVKDGVLHFCYSAGSEVQMVGEDGGSLGSFSFGSTVNAICADDTYVYGVAAGSAGYVFRYNHTTLATAPNLTTSATIRGYGASNKGFIAYYNGFIYTKASGSDTNVQIINTTTGAVTTQPALGESEAIGGAITVATDGVAWLINHGDTSAEAIRISDWSRTTFSTGMSPTTTHSNQCVCIGPGLVLVNDGSYSRSCIVNINSGVPVVTQVQGIFPLGNQYSLLAATPFLGGYGLASRSLVHSVLVAGVEVT